MGRSSPSFDAFLMRRSSGSMPSCVGELVERRLAGEHAGGRAGSAVGGGLGLVDDDVVAVDLTKLGMS